MRLDLIAAPLFTLCLACSFSSQGVPDGSGDEVANSETESGDTGMQDEVGTDQGTTMGDGDGDPSTTSTTTGDGDGDPSTTTESTTDTTTDTTDTTTDTTDTTTDTTDTTDTTTDTGMEVPPYANCPNGGADCAQGDQCKEDLDLVDNWQVCAQPCQNVGECPPADGLALTCLAFPILTDKLCYINCENNGPCPQGMACKSINAGFDHICAWD